MEMLLSISVIIPICKNGINIIVLRWHCQENRNSFSVLYVVRKLFQLLYKTDRFASVDSAVSMRILGAESNQQIFEPRVVP